MFCTLRNLPSQVKQRPVPEETHRVGRRQKAWADVQIKELTRARAGPGDRLSRSFSPPAR